MFVTSSTIGNVYCVDSSSISCVTAYFTVIFLFCSFILTEPGTPKNVSSLSVIPVNLKLTSFDNLLSTNVITSPGLISTSDKTTITLS